MKGRVFIFLIFFSIVVMKLFMDTVGLNRGIIYIEEDYEGNVEGMVVLLDKVNLETIG